MSQGLEDSGDFWRHSHCLLSQNHPLIDFVERLLVGGPPSMLSVYDDPDPILHIGIACSALGIIGNPHHHCHLHVCLGSAAAWCLTEVRQVP